MKYFTLILILLLGASLFGAGNGDYTLHLKEGLTLKDVFDAGIHPRQIRGMNSRAAIFKADSFTMVFPNGKSLTTKIGYGEFRVKEGKSIMTISFYETINTGIQEGLERLIRYNGILLRAGQSKEEIRAYINKVREAEDHWVGTTFGLSNAEFTESWKGSIIVNQSHNYEKPFQFIFNAALRDVPRKDSIEMFRHKQPLSAPEGYEHLSMDPEPLAPNDPNAEPILTPRERAKQLAEELRTESKLLESLKEDSAIKKPLKVAEEAAEKSSNWWLWLIGAVVAIGGIGLIARRKS